MFLFRLFLRIDYFAFKQKTVHYVTQVNHLSIYVAVPYPLSLDSLFMTKMFVVSQVKLTKITFLTSIESLLSRLTQTADLQLSFALTALHFAVASHG